MNLVENSLKKRTKLIKESQKDFDELSKKSSNELLDEWAEMQYPDEAFSPRIEWLIETILISRGWIKKLIKRSQKIGHAAAESDSKTY